MTDEELLTLLAQADERNIAADYDEAERMARNVLAELEKASDSRDNHSGSDKKELHSAALISIAESKWRRGDYQTALTLARTALGIAEDAALPESKAKALGVIGIQYHNLSDNAMALTYLQKGLAIYEDIGSKAGTATLLGSIGTVYRVLSDHENALSYLKKALAINEDTGNKSGIASSLSGIGNVFEDLSDYSQALGYMLKSLAIAEEIGTKVGIAANLHNIGSVYQSLSDYAKALEYFQMAMAINEEIGNRAWLANNLNHIGSVYSALTDYATALIYYQNALAIYNDIGSKDGKARLLGNIGNVYANLLDHTQALTFYQEALAHCEEIGIKEGIANNLGNIGLIYHQLSDYPNALTYMQRSLAIKEEIGNRKATAIAFGNLGALYANNDFDGYSPEKAEEYFLRAIAIHEEIGAKNPNVHKGLADLYEAQERWKEHSFHFKKYHRLEKETQSEEAKKQANLLEQRVQAAEQEKHLHQERVRAQATQDILHKVLPQSIADRLVLGEKVADYYDRVSILFADIVGFTPIASRMPAKAVLAFLNYVFGEFDRMASACGCEKIKTIGDGYLAVAGAPDSCEDHAERIARLAIEMSKDIILPDEIRKTLPKGAQFNLRIGIHTGPVFGGIVGENRFVYDIYSDAVNLAARMESHGEAGKIHVSDEFCFHLQNRMDSTGEDFGGIRFDEREEMEIKGKGIMRTYFLENTHS